MSSPSPTLSFKEKVSYGFGDLASVLYWQTFMLYFTYFYTDVFIIPAAVAATMFLVTRLFDGVNDPVMGMIADRTKTRWGKFRPYLLWLCVPFAISGVLVFTTPDLGYTGKLIWAYATFILVMVMYTAINIPYTALMGVISPNSDDRTTVSSYKFIFAFAAGIIISATLLPTTKYLGKDDDSIMSAALSNDTIVVEERKTGASTFIITATDEKGNERLHEIRFTTAHAEKNIIDVVNPLPNITLDQQFGEHRIPLDGVFRGSVHDNFSFRVSNADPDLVDVSVDGSQLMVSEVSPDQSGTAFIRLYAADERWGEHPLDFAIDIMEPDNEAPVLIDSTDIRYLDSGFLTKSIDLNDLFLDPDGDSLEFFAFSSDMELLEPIITNSKMELAEMGDGIAQISIIAIDHRGGRVEHTMTCIVRDPAGGNAPMVTNPQTGFEVAAGFGTFRIPLSDFFSDVDGQQISYEMVVVNEAKGWSRFFMIVGVFAIMFFLISFFGTKERVQPPKTQQTSVKNDIKELVTNAPWLILLAVTITFILFVAVRSSVTVHYFKYIIGHQAIALPFFGEGTYDFTALASAYNTIGQISSLLGVFVVLWISKILGKKKTFLLFFSIAVISTATVYFLTAEQLGLIFFLQITGSMTGGPLSVLLWAMYADTADYGEWKRGNRATGLVFSASTMSQKFGWAIGAYVALTLMAQVGFEPNVAQSQESLRGLLALFTLIPAGIGILSMLISLIYPLNEKRVKEITGDLSARRGELSPNESA